MEGTTGSYPTSMLLVVCGKSDELLDTDTFMNRISLHQMLLWVSILTSLKVQSIFNNG